MLNKTAQAYKTELGVQQPIDVLSDTWLLIQSWATDQLQQARERNDSLSFDEIRTAALRGRIKLLKELLDLPGVK